MGFAKNGFPTAGRRSGHPTANRSLSLATTAFVFTTVESEEIRVVLDKNGHPYQYIFWNMSWSPDSKQLAFKGRLTDKQEIAIVNMTGEPELQRGCGSDRHIASDLAWSPDGQRILFNMYSPKERKNQIYQLEPGSDQPEFFPAWTSSGPGGRSDSAPTASGWCYRRLTDLISCRAGSHQGIPLCFHKTTNAAFSIRRHWPVCRRSRCSRRRAMVGSVSGMHASPHRGASVEFAEYRRYVPGDDLRRLDWRAYGRTDRFYVKEFEADTNLRCCIVLDTSGSMNFGSGDVSKMQYARGWSDRWPTWRCSRATRWG